MPAMQPAKLWAASKMAALASVISTPRRNKSSGMAVPVKARRWHSASSSTALLVHTDHCPSKTAHNPAFDAPAAHVEAKRRQQIHDDIVIIPRVEGDVLTPGLGDRPDDV